MQIPRRPNTQTFLTIPLPQKPEYIHQMEPLNQAERQIKKRLIIDWQQDFDFRLENDLEILSFEDFLDLELMRYEALEMYEHCAILKRIQDNA